MTYYMMIEELDSDDDLVIEDEPDYMKSHDGISFEEGKVVYQPIPKIYHEFEASSSSEINEVIIAPLFQGPLVSKYVKASFDELEVDNIQFFPVELYHKNAEKKLDDYYIMNVVGSFDPIDYDKSEIEYYGTPEEKDIADIESLTFIPTDDLRLPKIFRLKPYLPLLVAHQAVKDSFEELGITGVKFYKPEEYSL